MAELRPQQQAVLAPLRERFIHADPPGTGKTPVGLRWLRAHEVERALILAPTNVLRHWEKLAATWFPELKVVISRGTAKQRLAAIADSFGFDSPVALVTNYSTFRQDTSVLLNIDFDAMLCDEAHKLKNRQAIVHKHAVKMARRTPLLELATGSPILNSADEAWSLLHLINPRRWSSFWRWAAEHFDIEQTTFYGKLPRPVTLVRNPKPGAVEKIRSDLGELLVMRDEAELLPDMPPLVETFYEVDLSPAERRIYDSLVKRHWAKEGDTVIWTANEVAKITRLRQLSSDWSQLLADETDEAGTKVKAAAELIENLHPHQVVVFVAYRGTAYKLIYELERRGVVAAPFTGDRSQELRDTAKQDFLDRKVRVIVGTFGAMAEGIDGLQTVSHHTVMVDLDWTPEAHRQAVGRQRRDGQQAEHVFVHYIVARDTVDQTVADALERKQEVIEALTGRPTSAVLYGGAKERV